MQRIGFIGLGTMGMPMARNLLQARMPLRVWNRSPKRMDDVPEGADVVYAPTARDVLRASSICILMLLDQEALDAVLERHTEDFAQNVEGRTLIAMGSVDPSYSAALARDIEAAGGSYLEAPVSGSRVPAERGQLVCLLGGDRATADAMEPVLRPMCKEQIYCGPAGHALRMKLAINLYLCSSLVALAEATQFARQAGLPLDQFAHAITTGPMNSDYVTMKLPKMINMEFTMQAGLADAHTSTRLIKAEAARLNAATPQLELSSELYARAVEALGTDVDMSAVIKALG